MSSIKIIGASEHNLKDISLEIPRGTYTVFTGLSGSGKSSLVYDTIYQEGRRRFLESLSSYARQFLGKMEKPEVESLEGLSPTIAIDQKTAGRSSRSTVGTITEVYDSLRLLFARLGTPVCPQCGEEIQSQSIDQIVDRLLATLKGKRVRILAPIVSGRKGEYRKELEELARDGYTKVRIDGEFYELPADITLSRYETHTIEVLIDRLRVTSEKQSRLAEGIHKTTEMTEGVVVVCDEDGEDHLFSTEFACPRHGSALQELEPRIFSFNNPQGACEECRGLGIRKTITPQKLIDPELSIEEGAIRPLAGKKRFSFTKYGLKDLQKVADHFGFSLSTPWKELSKEHQDLLLYGKPRGYAGQKWIYRRYSNFIKKKRIPGLIHFLEASYRSGGWYLKKYHVEETCPNCKGTRLKPESLSVLFRDKNIAQLSELTVGELLEFSRNVELDSYEKQIGDRLVKGLVGRLEFLVDVGLEYLTLGRRASTLAGGEAQRIRLASQIGSGLKGVLYVLDEPTIGLHPRDNQKLINTIKKLRDRGNTVLVVEHDLETMRQADYVIDIGPGAGEKGGEIMAQGTPRQVARRKKSVTAKYLSARKEIEVPPERREVDGDHQIKVVGAKKHNLKDIEVDFPLGVFNVVTGVSGSGKSTLVNLVLKESLDIIHDREEKDEDAPCERIEGADKIDKIIEIDQKPIGRTPRSCPATYTKVLGPIRDLYSRLPLSRMRGYEKGRFSFNVKAGRCENCKGAGVVVVEMQFLSDVEVPCEECDGRRFTPETLEVKYRDKNIYDVFNLTVEEAAEFFKDQPKIARILNVLCEIGLGYIRLGQPSTTLSGGEAQRIKLTRELRKRATGNTLYILDEPTTGLHAEDVQKLLGALNRLVKKGNTVIVIEHNLDVIKVADHIIDLGPDGGAGGGEVLFEGTPEELIKCKKSYTGKALKEEFATEEDPLPPYKSEKRGPDLAETDLAVKGARIHNLQSINATIPKESFSVITGVSGSGKTSLAFDTIFAEGQRRYVESLSTYARRFLGRLERPPLDEMEGISPAIAIDQKSVSPNPRSNVATNTEIYDYLRLLYARVGTPHCLHCKKALEAYSPSRAAREVIEKCDGEKVHILAPLYMPHIKSLPWPYQQDMVEEITEPLIEQGFFRGRVGRENRRLEDLTSFYRKKPVYLVVDRMRVDSSKRERLAHDFEVAYSYGCEVALVHGEKEEDDLAFSQMLGCVDCGDFRHQDPSPRLFSFNSHFGACPRCEGLGSISGKRSRGGRCSKCDGRRLKPIPLSFTIGGKNIMETLDLTVEEAFDFFENLHLDESEETIAEQILVEVEKRLRFLLDVGLGYLNLNRRGDTLSGGESQRIRLATQIGNQLSGVLYILDEPTIGLHHKDISALYHTLRKLQKQGNTVLLVEHDPYIISQSDYVIDLGPRAGHYGGKIVAEGSPKEIEKSEKSLTGQYLAGKKRIDIPSERRKGTGRTLHLQGAKTHNLKDIDIKIPVGALTLVTGVSGSGKSSLVMETLLPALDPVEYDIPEAHFDTVHNPPLNKIVLIDQSPIGRSPRSNPGTYSKVFNKIRSLYASLPLSRQRGYDKSYFSFNTGDGRCSACDGNGVKKISMHFLADVWVDCEVCKGARYHREAREVRYRGQSISDVLDMEIGEARELFSNQKSIVRYLDTLCDVGLDYIKLGQSSTTLSGGEAQRLKLAKELGGMYTDQALYVLDEPTTGLHLDDISQLVEVLHRLVDEGATVVVIEHNLDVIAQADYIIDLGPEAGFEGGHFVAGGTPEELVGQSDQSHTGRALKEFFPSLEKRSEAKV